MQKEAEECGVHERGFEDTHFCTLVMFLVRFEDIVCGAPTLFDTLGCCKRRETEVEETSR